MAFALIILSSNASAQIPAYKSWLVNGLNLYTLAPNVGIGTTNPGQRLTIGIPEALLQTNNVMAIFDPAVAYITTRATANNVEAVFGVDPSNGFALYAITNHPITFGTGNVQKMKISAAGGLSLGASFFGIDPGANNMIVQGNVGIGKTSPAVKLDVNGTVQMTGFRLPTNAASGFVLTSDASGTGTWQPISGGGIGGNGTINRIPKFTAATTLGNSQIFDNGANVGIGTTSPAAKLDVVGTIRRNASTTIIFTKCVWRSVEPTIGSCPFPAQPPLCPAGFTDVAFPSFGKVITAVGNFLYGYDERICGSNQLLSVVSLKCTWGPANPLTLGTCTPPSCQAGFMNLGIVAPSVVTVEGLAGVYGYSERLCAQ